MDEKIDLTPEKRVAKFVQKYPQGDRWLGQTLQLLIHHDRYPMATIVLHCFEQQGKAYNLAHGFCNGHFNGQRTIVLG